MSACHTKPFLGSGLLIASTAAAGAAPVDASEEPGETADGCDYCGSAALEWRKCKLICTNCRQINKSCADL
jgi:hypothetical protein